MFDVVRPASTGPQLSGESAFWHPSALIWLAQNIGPTVAGDSLTLEPIYEHREETMRELCLMSLAACLLIVTGGMATRVAAAPADDDFVMKAAQAGKMEVELGRLAAKKGRSAAVKSFGRRMVTDHTAAGNKLEILAAKKHISLPTEMDPEAHEAMQRLTALSGNAFDRAYMEIMVGDHEKAIAEFEMESTGGTDADIKAFAGKTLPTLKTHLRVARAAAAKVK
jgi:putative membrane protein